jgi:glycosyltransferase involved in cell wall biosynthesis
MTILFFPSWYPSSENPVNGVFFREQALALKQAGVDVYVLSMTFYRLREILRFVKIKNRMTYQNDGGVETFRLSYLKFFPRFEALFLRYSALVFKKIFHYIEKQRGTKFDIVHIHAALDAGLIYYLSKINTKYVITEHSTMYQRKLLSDVQKKYLPLCFASAVKLIAVGNGLKEAMSAFTSRRIEVIYNLVFLDLFRLLPKKKKMGGDKFRFFSLGMSAYKKGFDILLAAYHKIAMLESTELCIAGLSSDEINLLCDMVVQYRLENHVILLEKIPREEVVRQMQCADCFVLTSRFETFGVVFIEAMACGKPVIASKTGGPDSFIAPETGILVPVENIAETTAAMETMYSKAASFNSDNIRKYAIENFSSSVIAKKLIGIYEEVHLSRPETSVSRQISQV